MGLNDLHLPPTVVSALYPGSLVSLDSEITSKPEKTTKPAAPVEKEAEEPILKYLGNNKKNILVVVSYPDAVHLPDEALTFLTNMLTACKLSLGDVAIVNRKNYPEGTYKDLVAQFKSKTVFLFGIDPLDFGMPVGFPHYQVQHLANSTFLYSPSLDEHKNDPLLKSKLWVSLRNIFGI